MDRLNAALEAANGLLTGLELHIEQYGSVVAQRLIDAANAEADARVATAEQEAERQGRLVAELRRIVAAMERARDLAIRERNEAWELLRTAAEVDRG
jgi:hypothetical protein